MREQSISINCNFQELKIFFIRIVFQFAEEEESYVKQFANRQQKLKKTNIRINKTEVKRVVNVILI